MFIMSSSFCFPHERLLRIFSGPFYYIPFAVLSVWLLCHFVDTVPPPPPVTEEIVKVIYSHHQFS